MANTVQILRKVYKSKLVSLLQYKLVPLPTSGVSHLLHEELRGEGVQNETILSRIKQNTNIPWFQLRQFGEILWSDVAVGRTGSIADGQQDGWAVQSGSTLPNWIQTKFTFELLFSQLNSIEHFFIKHKQKKLYYEFYVL